MAKNSHGEEGELARIRDQYNKEKDPAKKQALRDKLVAGRDAAGLNTSKGTTPADPQRESLGKFFGGDKTAVDAALAGQGLYDNQVTKPTYTDPFSAAMNDVVNLGKERYLSSGQNDANVQKTLDTMLGGLGGYTPDELQRFREENMGGVNTALQTGLRSAGFDAAGRGIGGGAAGALGYGAMKNFANSAAGLERKLFLDNMTEKANRLNAFGNYAFNAQEAGKADRTQAFQNMYQATGTSQQAAFNIGRYNNDSLTEWELGRLGALTAGPNYINTRKDTDRALKIQDKAASSKSSSGGDINVNLGSSGGTASGSYGWEMPSGNSGLGKSSALPS